MPRQKRGDDWETDFPEQGYSPSKFYTKALDDTKTSTFARFRLKHWLQERVGDLVASKKIPEYRQPGDFYRDAVLHRLYYLETEISIDGVNNTLRQIMAMETLLEDDKYNRGFKDTLDKADEAINSYLREKDIDRAKELASQMMALVSSINEPFWRNRYLNEMRRKWLGKLPE